MSKGDEPSKQGGPQAGEFQPGESGLLWGTQSLWRALRGIPVILVESREAAWHPLLPAISADIRHLDGVEEVGWVAYAWGPPQAQSQPPKGARIATSVRRLMAQERRRMRRSTLPHNLNRRDKRDRG